jgi:hypothetical protein
VEGASLHLHVVCSARAEVAESNSAQSPRTLTFGTERG